MSLKLTRRRAVLGGIALVVIALAVWAALPDPVLVEVATVIRSSMRVIVDEDGRTRVADRYILTAPVAGRLERIGLREGASVEAGQSVARIEPLPLDERAREQLRAALDAAQARERAAASALAQAEAASRQASRELERRRALVEQGAIAEEQIEQYELAARTRDEELESARQGTRVAAAEVQAARAALLVGDESGTGAAIAVQSPVAGEVLRVPERSGRVVNAGEPLLELGGTGVIEGVVDVLSTDAVRIAPGMPAQLVGWGGPPLVARVRLVEPSAFTDISALGVEEQRVNVILDIDECPPELGDGYRIEAEIVVWSAHDVLNVPSSALFREGEVWKTFVVEDGRAASREVVPGERSGATTQIVSGLEEGDTVILFPSDELRDGVAVRPAAEE